MAEKYFGNLDEVTAAGDSDVFAVEPWLGHSWGPLKRITKSNLLATLLPSQAGHAGGVLTTDGAGALLWVGTAAINISGNAATATNGVVTTGSYSDPAWVTALAASKLTGLVGLSQGGTGQGSATAALNALLPAQTGHASACLTTDGLGGVSWGGVVSSLTNSDGTLTVSQATGAVALVLNTANANTWTAAQTLTLPQVAGTQPAALTLAPGVYNDDTTTLMRGECTDLLFNLGVGSRLFHASYVPTLQRSIRILPPSFNAKSANVPLTSIVSDGSSATATLAFDYGVHDSMYVFVGGADQPWFNYNGANNTIHVLDPLTFTYTLNPRFIAALTASGGTATATLSVNHGLLTGDTITITNSTQSAYNVSQVQVTRINNISFSFPVVGSPPDDNSGVASLVGYDAARGTPYLGVVADYNVVDSVTLEVAGSPLWAIANDIVDQNASSKRTAVRIYTGQETGTALGLRNTSASQSTNICEIQQSDGAGGWTTVNAFGPLGQLFMTPPALTSGSPTVYFQYTGPTHTTLANAGFLEINFSLAAATFTGPGFLGGNHRGMLINGGTLSASSSSASFGSNNRASSLEVTACRAGSNMTITHNIAASFVSTDGLATAVGLFGGTNQSANLLEVFTPAAGTSSATLTLRTFINGAGGLSVSPRAGSSTTTTASSLLTMTSAGNVSYTAATEFFEVDWNFSNSTHQFLTGNLSLQRSFRIRPRTYRATGASTFTTACTLEITGAPVASTNVVISKKVNTRLLAGTANDVPLVLKGFTAQAAHLLDVTDVNDVVLSYVDPNANWVGGSYAPTATLSEVASAVAWNLATQQIAKLTLTGSDTLSNPTNMVDGGMYLLRLTQGGSGSNTIAYGNAYRFPGGSKPTLSTAVGAVDYIRFVSDGTHMDMLAFTANLQ